MILDSIYDLRKTEHGVIAMTSMPGDPIHPGHISCLQKMRAAVEDCYRQAELEIPDFRTVCIVNSDQFLINKKGFAFMPLEDRMSIIDSIRNGPDYVIPFFPSNQSDQTVSEAIDIIKPNFFVKGGDRLPDKTLPEWDTCQKNNCVIIGHVGADKVWSSSNYLKRYEEFIRRQILQESSRLH